MIVALDNGIVLGFRKFKHLIDESRNTVGILDDLMIDVVKSCFVIIRVGHSHQLGKARQNVKWRSYLMGNLLDEIALHA